MERRLPLKLSRALAGTLCLLLLAGIGYAAPDRDRSLVLVAGAGSRVAPLTLAQTRRLYLGAPLEKEGQRITPVRNLTDTMLYQVFLQKVMYMSAGRYERLLVSRVFRGGGRRLATVSTHSQLVETLGSDPYAVSYMWEQAALADPNIRIVGRLWQGEVE